MRQVLLYPSDDMWVAEVPSLPGTISFVLARQRVSHMALRRDDPQVTVIAPDHYVTRDP